MTGETGILVLESGCMDCASVKAEIDWGKAGDPTYSGKNGDRLFVYVCSNSEATKNLSLVFGCDKVAPFLILDGQGNGEPEKVFICDVDKIISHINISGFGRR